MSKCENILLYWPGLVNVKAGEKGAEKVGLGNTHFNDESVSGGIKMTLPAERDGAGIADMPKGQAKDARRSQPEHPIFDDVNQGYGKITVFMVGLMGRSRKRPEDQASNTLQLTGQQQLSEVPVDPVGGFINIFKKEDWVPRIRFMRGAQKEKAVSHTGSFPAPCSPGFPGIRFLA